MKNKEKDIVIDYKLLFKSIGEGLLVLVSMLVILVILIPALNTWGLWFAVPLFISACLAAVILMARTNYKEGKKNDNSRITIIS